MMPEMDGYEVCRMLKADARTWHIPIIFVTAKSDPVDEAKVFSLVPGTTLSNPQVHRSRSRALRRILP